MIFLVVSPRAAHEGRIDGDVTGDVVVERVEELRLLMVVELQVRGLVKVKRVWNRVGALAFSC